MTKSKAVFCALIFGLAGCGAPTGEFVAEPLSCDSLDLGSIPEEARVDCRESQQDGRAPVVVALVKRVIDPSSGSRVIVVQAQGTVADVEGESIERVSLSAHLALLDFGAGAFLDEHAFEVSLSDGNSFGCVYTIGRDLVC